MLRTAPLLATLLAVAACGDDDAPAPHTETPSNEAPVAPEPDGLLPGAPDATDLAEADVRAVLDAWLAAQNAGDFAAYSALYAERFEGVKRSAERTYRFDRAGWLDDRRRMFARPMTVEAAEVSIALGPRSSVVSFEQRWAAATFRDVGPKMLVVVREGDALRIAREEMLRSTEGDSAAGGIGPGQLLLVVDAGGLHGVIAPAAIADAEEGVIELRRQAEPSVASRRLRVDALPEPMRIGGREYALYSPTGVECTVRVTELRALRRVVPHFGTVQTWRGEFGDPPRTEPQIAADVWDLGAEASALVTAVLDAPAACAREPIAFAVPTSATSPTLFPPRPADDALVRRAIAAFRALPAWRAVQSTYTSFPHTGAWHEHEGARPTVLAWTEPRSRRTFVSVHSRVGAGCAEFYGALWGLFEDDGTRLVSRVEPVANAAFEPRAVLDLDGDGRIEVVVPDGLFVTNEAGMLERALDVTPPYFDCDC